MRKSPVDAASRNRSGLNDEASNGHTKPIGIESKYSKKIFLIGGWMVGGWMMVVVTSVQKSPTCVYTYTTSK